MTHKRIHYYHCYYSKRNKNNNNNIIIVPAGSPSRGGDVAVYVFDINELSLLTPFYSVLVSVSAFTALSTVFHSINSPDNSPFSHSVFPV